MVGAAPVVEIGLLAFHTLTVRAGTVTLTDPSADGLTALSVPRTGVKTAPEPFVQVGKVAVAALVPLFAATTYSTWPAFLPPLVPAPIREVAKMPAPWAAKRLTWAP